MAVKKTTSKTTKKQVTTKAFPNTPAGKRAAAKWAGAEGPKSSLYSSKKSKGGESGGFFGSPGQKRPGYVEERGRTRRSSR